MDFHQAHQNLYDTVGHLLMSMEQRGKIDQTLFIKSHKGHILLVQIYVDDIIFGSTKKELCEEFEKLMKDKFQMSSMGELTFFLGLQVQQKKKGIFISQDKYVHEILKKFNYTDVKSASTPTDLERPLVKDADADDVDEHLYRSMIGSLMYLTASRPDIMFAVCACARFQVSPKTSHLLAVKRIFRYLKGKPSLGLWYSKDSPLELVAYTDSDYAGATLDRKSTTGGCQFLGNRLIFLQCKKPTMLPLPQPEAEYVACCYTICIIENPVQHSKTKHIEIRHHFIRDCNTKKLIQMAKIDTQLNVADLLTKGFDAGRFQYLVSREEPCWMFLECWLLHHTTNGHQFTMSNTHQELASPEQTATALASPEQTATGKDFSNPFIVGSLLKTIWLSLHHIFSNEAMASPKQTAIGSAGFHQIIDFINRSHICYALTKKPEVCVSFVKQFWRTAEIATMQNAMFKIHATIDGHSLSITEGSIRRHLKLDDKDGLISLPSSEIFAQLALMGYATNSDKLTFQKGAFSPQWRLILSHTRKYTVLPTQSIFSGSEEADLSGGSSLKKWKVFSDEISTAGKRKILLVKKVPPLVRLKYKLSTRWRKCYISRRNERGANELEMLEMQDIARQWNKGKERQWMKLRCKGLWPGCEKERTTEKNVEKESGAQRSKRKTVNETVNEPAAKRKKSIPRKTTRKRQKLEVETEKEELKTFLDIVPREEAPIDIESLSTKFPIVDWKTIGTETHMYYQVSRFDQGVGSTSGIRACALRYFDLGKMELENSQNNSLAKLPILKLGEYEMWEIRIKQYFQIQDYALWEVIENGNSWVPIPVTAPESGPSTALKMTVPSTTEEKIGLS
ncbi:putative ribonuclease H-like domain-containing protein [Tanacetum coccineum]|uniref:Ribonuclease H-like domain-containing protein n=1 Tax=Tanacetum coccineum TaxID=301880 RepID=A0ABQ5DRI9_9ASTR